MNRLVLQSAWLAGLAVGCTSDEPTLILTVQAETPPALIAFRDESSMSWQVLTVPGAVTFDIAISGPYRVAIACDGGGPADSIRITEFARTPDDGDTLNAPCRAAFPFRVRGTMVQPGGVAFGGFGGRTSQSNWSFEFPSRAGKFEVVMTPGDFTAGPDSIAIRRDVSITGDTDLGRLDATAEHAQPLVAASFTANNLLAGETRAADVLLDTGGTVTSVETDRSSNAWTVKLAPTSVLRAEDRQTVTLTAIGTPASPTAPQPSRSVRRDFRVGDPTEVTLPPVFDGLAFETSTSSAKATWSTLPKSDTVRLTRFSISSSPLRLVSHDLAMTRSFIDDTRATTATLDLSALPGFKNEWKMDPDLAQTVSLSATLAANGDTMVSSAVIRLDGTMSAGSRAPAVEAAGATIRWRRALGTRAGEWAWALFDSLDPGAP